MTERFHDTWDGELSDEHDHIVELPDPPGATIDGPAADSPLQAPPAGDIEGPEESSIGPADLDLRDGRPAPVPGGQA